MPTAQRLWHPLDVLQGARAKAMGVQARAGGHRAPACPAWLLKTTSLKKSARGFPNPAALGGPDRPPGPRPTQLQVFLVTGPSGPASHVSEHSFCPHVLPSDASDEQNSQSPAEHSMNSAEKAERQPPGDAGPGAETSSVSQVPRSRSPRGSQIGREPAGVSGVR